MRLITLYKETVSKRLNLANVLALALFALCMFSSAPIIELFKYPDVARFGLYMCLTVSELLFLKIVWQNFVCFAEESTDFCSL